MAARITTGTTEITEMDTGIDMAREQVAATGVAKGEATGILASTRACNRTGNKTGGKIGSKAGTVKIRFIRPGATTKTGPGISRARIQINTPLGEGRTDRRLENRVFL